MFVCSDAEGWEWREDNGETSQRWRYTLPTAALQEKDHQRSDVAEKRHRKQQHVGDGVGAVLERIVVMETCKQLHGGVVANNNGSGWQVFYKTYKHTHSICTEYV